MKTNSIPNLLLVGVLFTLLLAGCDALPGNEEEGITASGIVEAVEISAAPEVSGRIAEVYVSEGDRVTAGQQLLLLENEVLEAQYDQAEAALEAAEANLSMAEFGLSAAQANAASAQTGLGLAQLQYKMALKQANLAEMPQREFSWDQDTPSEFDLPSWYFSMNEEITALEVEIESAYADLAVEQDNLADVLDEVSNADFRAAEVRLANAQAAFLVADLLLDRQIEQNGREAIDDYVQSLYDAAEAEMESAQTTYDIMLSSEQADDVLEARGRVEVANERYYAALSLLYNLQIGPESLEVASAQLGVEQAHNNVAQAEAALGQAEASVSVADTAVIQAQASLDILDIQLGKLIVTAPSGGVVLSSSVEEGELVQPGITVMVIGELDDLKITVYLAEDVYGQINLGDQAEVQVDSYPDDVFKAEVIQIADQAEYTPRNVQTEEDRRTTVFAIELVVSDHGGKLKPGMPADVSFLQ